MWEFAGVNMQGAEDWMQAPLVCLLTDLINHCHWHSILIYILFSTYLFQIVYVLNNNILDTIMILMGIISIIITSIPCPLPCPLTHLHTYSTSPALHPHRTPSHPPAPLQSTSLSSNPHYSTYLVSALYPCTCMHYSLFNFFTPHFSHACLPTNPEIHSPVTQSGPLYAQSPSFIWPVTTHSLMLNPSTHSIPHNGPLFTI